MMSRMAIGLGLLLLVLGSGMRMTPPAEAQLGPSVAGGALPYVTVTGSVPIGATTTVYTVPAGSLFVLTGVGGFSPNITIYEDSDAKVLAGSGAFWAGEQAGPLARGVGHTVFQPGSSVNIENIATAEQPYYLQGYLAHP